MVNVKHKIGFRAGSDKLTSVWFIVDIDDRLFFDEIGEIVPAFSVLIGISRAKRYMDWGVCVVSSEGARINKSGWYYVVGI
jgi:hypothetical protein